MPDLVLGSTTVISDSSGSLAWGSSVTFPAGMVIKSYGKVFKGVQTITATVPNNTTDVSDAPQYWVVVGTGATGDDGDPLNITVDTPASSSSKFLIRSDVTYSRKQDGSHFMGWWYRTAGTSDTYAPVVQGKSGVYNYWTQAAFGSSHHSTTGGYGNYGVRQGSMEYLWSPSSSVGLQIQVMVYNYSGSAPYINRPYNVDPYSYMGTFISTLTVQEIAG